MSTSLASQLRKLAAPQTTLLLEDKKRASLLFNPKEAANFDRQTIYELGIGGLDELKTLNGRFSEFESTLFDLASQSFQRAVQSEKVNQKLNLNIKKFLHLLSPYFLLKPSHKVLEWLINRFHIHRYNVDDLLMLAFPYHESRIFVRVVQLLDLSDASGRWHWLKPLQQPGIPLSKQALLNHASSSPAFVKLLCETTVGAVKEYGSNAHVLSTHLAFYCTTLLGVLDQSKTGVSEIQMTHMHDALLLGLVSSVADYAAASYMILGKLVSTNQLSKHILHKFIKNITKNQSAGLQAERTMLLILIFQSQQDLKDIPKSSLLRLAAKPGTTASLGQLAAGKVCVTPLIVPILTSALQIIQTEADHRATMCAFVESLINEIRFDDESARSVIKTVIDSYKPTQLDESNEDQVDEENENSEAVAQWYSEILSRFERSYPTVFDEAVCFALRNGGLTASRASGLQKMLGFELHLDLLDKLRHTKSKIRAEALRLLAKQCDVLKEKDYATLKDSILELLHDSSAEVVSAVLSFSPKALQQLVGVKHLHESLVSILLSHSFAEQKRNKWPETVLSAISVICNLDVKGESNLQDAISVLVLLPHMLVDNQASKIILSSPLVTRCNFLKAVKSDMSKKKKQNVAKVVCDVILQHSGLFELSTVMDLCQLLIKGDRLFSDGVHIAKFNALLMLAASLPKISTSDISLEVLQTACLLTENHQLSISAPTCDINEKSLSLLLDSCFKNFIPLEGLLNVVRHLITQTKWYSKPKDLQWLNLESGESEIVFLVRMFHLLSSGYGNDNPLKRSAYAAILKSFFKEYFSTHLDEVKFLSNFWTSHAVVPSKKMTGGCLGLDVQLRSLRLAAVLLKSVNAKESWPINLDSSNALVPSLLIALSCSAAPVRKAAIEVVDALCQIQAQSISYHHLLNELNSRAEELMLDAEQLQLVLYILLSPDVDLQNMRSASIQSVADKITQVLLDCVQSETTPPYVSAKLISLLTAVNSEAILIRLLPLVSRILEMKKDSNQISRHSSTILRNIIRRIDTQTIQCFSSNSFWNVLGLLFKEHTIAVLDCDGEVLSPAVLVCEQVTRELWEAFPPPVTTHQQRLLSLLTATGSEAETPEVLSAVTRCLRHLTLEAELIVVELKLMRDASVIHTQGRVTRRSVATQISPQILETKEWRRGVTLLEIIQNKKKINNVPHLLPVLFDILKKCLEFEEQAPVEYVKQLVLSCILHCCQKLAPVGTTISVNVLPPEVLNVESVVQCVRATQNPQTHHHALLLLAHLAGMVPEQVLHNIMAIFTFMGSLVLRQDDAYSFQVITKTVESIIPVLIKASHEGVLTQEENAQLELTIASVMRVFVDALLDIPEHRRLSVFHKLLSTLSSEQYLWIFLCLVLESHVLHNKDISSDSKRSKQTGAETEVPKRLEVALQIATKFSPKIVLINSIRLLKYVRAMPMEKDEKNTNVQTTESKELANLRIKTLFNVEQNSAKHLRHYKYTIITFTSALLSSVPFINEVFSLSEKDMLELEPLFEELLEAILGFVQLVARQADLCAGAITGKYWKVMFGQTCDILDKVNALLPSNVFLSVMRRLMCHKLPTLRRKAMELLNGRLSSSSSQRDAFLNSCGSENLLSLVDPLHSVVASIQDNVDSNTQEKTSDEQLLNQQTALLSIKYLAKNLAFDNHQKFKEVLVCVTNLLRSGKIMNQNLLGSVVLCAAELCSSLRAHAIFSLPTLMPALVKLLSEQAGQESANVLQLSVVSATFRVVDTLSAFLSPYLQVLLTEVCILSAIRSREEEEQNKGPLIASKLKAIRQKLGTAIPLRILIPSVENTYQELVRRKELAGIGPLMSILSEGFGSLSSSELSSLQSMLTEFFLSALQFRSACALDKKSSVSCEDINNVEEHVVKALVALALKMSESSFRPFYYKLFEWATRLEDYKERTITFYRLSCSMAESLKSLFVLFAGHFLKNASTLLDYSNISKVGPVDISDNSLSAGLEPKQDRPKELYFGSGPKGEEKSTLLVQYILKTLHYVFLFDAQSFVTKERFDTLMQPIVDQLENTLGGMEALQQRATEVLCPCIGQLAAACTDDTLWKALNYQILLKTRHHLPTVRLAALEAVCGVARKLGEGFLPLLPETVPFLAELMEDEEETVEQACRKAVQDLEQVLDEPIQKYF